MGNNSSCSQYYIMIYILLSKVNKLYTELITYDFQCLKVSTEQFGDSHFQ